MPYKVLCYNFYIDTHELISLLKQAAADLGHRPSRDEFCRHTGTGKSKIERLFGTYTELCKATFGESVKQDKSTKKLITQFFSRDIEDLLRDSPLKLQSFSNPCREITIAIGDAHFPFVCVGSLMLIYQLIEIVYAYCIFNNIKLNIIQGGDLFDMFSFGHFARSHCLIRPDEELRLGIEMSKQFWATIRKLAPEAKCFQILGNHDLRPMKKIIASNAPELECFMNFKGLFEFEGVTTYHDARENVFIDGIQHTHGHLKGGTHRAKLGTHVVHYHTHKGGMVFSKVNGKWLYEIDGGYVGDPDSPCFTYTQKKSDNQAWQKGVTLLTPWGFQFIPFED